MSPGFDSSNHDFVFLREQTKRFENIQFYLIFKREFLDKFIRNMVNNSSFLCAFLVVNVKI